MIADLHGHYGCPKCRHQRCAASHHSEYLNVKGTFQPQRHLDEAAFTRDGDGFQRGAVPAGLKSCLMCGHIYSDAAFWLDTFSPMAGIAAKQSLRICRFSDGFIVRVEPHASLIMARETRRQYGFGPEVHPAVACATCRREIEVERHKTIELYADCPTTPSGRETMLDRRQLPILLTMKLCRKCLR